MMQPLNWVNDLAGEQELAVVITPAGHARA
jgi:hypothetical protein